MAPTSITQVADVEADRVSAEARVAWQEAIRRTAPRIRQAGGD